MGRRTLDVGAFGSGASWPGSDEDLGDGDPHAPASQRARSGSAAVGSDLGGAIQPGTRDPGDRLLHRRVHLAQDPRDLRD
jgi:hypothetical protein